MAAKFITDAYENDQELIVITSDLKWGVWVLNKDTGETRFISIDGRETYSVMHRRAFLEKSQRLLFSPLELILWDIENLYGIKETTLVYKSSTIWRKRI